MKNNLIQQPTKKYLILNLLTWFISSIIILLFATDYFQESPFQKKNLVFGLLLIYTTIRAAIILRNYLKTKSA